jgi:hypothetical protein
MTVAGLVIERRQAEGNMFYSTVLMNACRLSEGKRPVGRPSCRLLFNIKMYLTDRDRGGVAGLVWLRRRTS